MKEKKSNNLKININRVYTKKGDSGTTSIIGGHKFKKSSNRIKAFGEVDELNVIVGMCIYDINSVKDDYSNNLISILDRNILPRHLGIRIMCLFYRRAVRINSHIG